MADFRRRNRNKKRDDQSSAVLTPVIIARREDPRIVQPKILLNKDRDRDKERERDRTTGRDRTREKDRETEPSPNSTQRTPSTIKTLYINRTSDAVQADKCYLALNGPAAGGSPVKGSHLASVPSPTSVCSALVSAAPNGRDKNNCSPASGAGTAAAGTAAALQDPPRMNRATPLLLANGIFNVNARRLFHKTNTDFTVIGVLGAQCSGKSTLLNLLSAERSLDYDYYQHLLSPEADGCIFATRHKVKPKEAQKSVLRPRTESLQFFITRERHILLDTPPLLTVANEPDYLDLHSVAEVAQLLSVCHILILAIDGLAVEQLRLINAALRLRPRFPCKGYVQDHLPQVLFVRTRAQRQDFEPQQRERLDKKLAHLYGVTGLPIYRGRGEARAVNTFLLPEVSANGATAYHAPFGELVRQFRERVLGSTRVSMCHTSTELSEAIWFEILAEGTRKSAPNFEKIYADLKLRHLDMRQWRPDNWRATES
ncbi:protein SMG9 [Drosophila kikkawai]|uniref:Protein SMG9 n=1 Tax=Drosophila kikkawai TaxID=30033 RepID=A0A6P4JNQ3_DROKI|nr:protein SMG9 [Drosophila kikkawai]